MATKHVPSPALANLRLMAKELGKAEVKVGYFETAKYPDKKSTPVAYVAAIQEFGYAEGGIPPRPTMRPTIENKQGEWAKMTAGGARAIVKGSATSDMVLNALGDTVAGDFKRAIADLTSPPLSPETLRARRNRKERPNASTKPLVDQYQQLMKVTHVVEKS